MEYILSNSLHDSINQCIVGLRKKFYDEKMYKKNHTLHCFIARYFGYFMHRYTVWELDRCAGKFGCDDINILSITPLELDLKINEICTYVNTDFIQYEIQADVDLAILEMYRNN